MATRKKENPPQDLQARYRSEVAQLDRRKDRRQQQEDQKHLNHVLKLPKPVTMLRGSYSLPEPPPPIPKLTDPKKTPKKKVRRELDRDYQSKRGFLSKVEQYTRGKFIIIRPDDRIPDFQEFEDDQGIEVLLAVFNLIPTEFHDRDEIRRFLASSWKDTYHELHIYLIACGVWKFILLHCEDVQEGTSEAKTDENEMAGLPATTTQSAEQGTERSATNGAKDFDPRELGKRERGKLIGIALSGKRSGIGTIRIVTCMAKTKAPCLSTSYETFKDWYRKDSEGFHKFLFRLRGEGEKWEGTAGQRIPDKYYEKYK